MREFRHSVPDYMLDTVVKGFNEMKPFKRVEDIPDIPRVDEKTYKEVIIPNLVRCGAIPKPELITGKVYIGKCDECTEAIWILDHFVYKIHHYGIEIHQTVKHFEDEDGFDVFVPISKKN